MLTFKPAVQKLSPHLVRRPNACLPACWNLRGGRRVHSRFINKIKLRIWTNVDLPKRGSCSAKLGVRFCDGRSMLLRGWSESEKRVYQSRSDLKRQAFSLNERSKELFPESNGIVACIWFFSNVNIRCLLRMKVTFQREWFSAEQDLRRCKFSAERP